MEDEDIEVGEYVRTYTGVIAKVYDFYPLFHTGQVDVDVGYVDKKSIKKHSFNITKLIKKGDYVNGYLVIKVDAGYVYVNRETADGKILTFSDYQINSIVTKEKFKLFEYKVE